MLKHLQVRDVAKLCNFFSLTAVPRVEVGSCICIVFASRYQDFLAVKRLDSYNEVQLVTIEKF